jgi:riboflavin kinase/FMN adenylyltransferase
MPKRGIYATVCITPDGKRYAGVSNVGVRPTITDGSDAHAVNCETYIHNFDGRIYGENLTVEFHEYLREEKKFESTEELSDQISRDLESTLAFFNRSGIDF